MGWPFVHPAQDRNKSHRCKNCFFRSTCLRPQQHRSIFSDTDIFHTWTLCPSGPRLKTHQSVQEVFFQVQSHCRENPLQARCKSCRFCAGPIPAPSRHHASPFRPIADPLLSIAGPLLTLACPLLVPTSAPKVTPIYL